ncbi:MAG: MotA/TolQ/ExbB proton channel family protein [Ignavibacteriaceae bacterium]|nr:MotA/TolQ/ExbB proton channel family protein [Ignavibacteriaceae bacterium]
MIRKSSTLGGLLLGVLSIFGAFFWEGGAFEALFLIPPILIVFGGTFAAIIIGFGFDKFKNILRLMYLAYFPNKYNINGLINNLVDLSIMSRKEGLLSVEKKLDRLEYVFPRKLVKYVIDGTDAESLQNLAALEIRAMQERHYSNIFIFTKMGGYAPTMGIIGTVMGLIMSLAHAGGDPNSLIKNIASAFIATLWGVFSANIIWLPIGDKLKKCHLEEKHMMEISLEGILALQSGEIPSVVKARLLSLLPQKEQLRMMLS